MRIQLKLRVGFLLVVLIMAIASGVILWNQSRMREAFEVSNASIRLEDYLLECRRQEKNYLLRGDQQYVKYFQMSFDSLYAKTTQLIPTIKHKSLSTELTTLSERESSYKTAYDTLIQIYYLQDYPKNKRDALLDQMVENARNCHALIANIRSMALAEFDTAKSTSHLINIAALIIGILLSVLIAGIISDKIIQQMEENRE